MKIGFDAKRAVKNFTGLGNYSRLVIESVAKEMADSQMLLYTPILKDNPRLDKIRNLSNVEFRTPPPQGFRGSLWRTFGISNNLDADKVEVFHGLSNELPLTIRSARVKSVVTVHDLIYRTMPDCYKWIDRKLYDYKYRKSCENADHIVAISKCTKRDIIEYYNIPEEKISVIYQGCDDIFRNKISPDQIAQLRHRWELPQRYLVQVGTIEKRKNLELSVKALPEVEPDIKLVVVGRNRLGYKEYVEKIAESNGTAGRIIWLDKLPFTDLPALYSGAVAALNPSRYEGFGIPVLEALETRTPVVAATGSCLEEAGGPASLYVSPDDARGMAEAIKAIVSGSLNVNQMREEGKRHAASFSTERMAAQLTALYSSLIRK